MLANHPNLAPVTSSPVDPANTNKIHNHSQTRLTPQTYLEIKQERSERIFTETYPLNRKSVIQKYFGKKVLYVERHLDLMRSTSSRKFFARVKLSEIRFKKNNVITVAKVFGSSDFNCLGSRIFLDKSIQLHEKESWKLISTSTSDITMNFNYYHGPRSLKPIRLFSNNLRNLKLTVPTNTWSANSKGDLFGMGYLQILEDVLPLLTHLEAVTLQLTSSFEIHSYNKENEVQMNVFLKFLQKLIKLKSLKTINLDLYNKQIYSRVLKDLLFCLNASHLEKWHIIAKLSAEEMLNVKTIGTVLEKIDFLGLKFRNFKYQNYFECIPEYIPGNLREMPELTSKRTKVLDLNILDRNNVRWKDDESNIPRLSEILSYCKSLEGLYIKSLWNRINWDMTESDMVSLAQVKDLVLVLDEREIDTDQFLKTFLSTFKTQNFGLRSLKIFFRYTSNNDEEPDYNNIKFRISAYINGFYGMESLEDLTLYSDGCEDLDEPELGFESLTNLKRFTLHRCASKRADYWDDEFPFQNLSHITEFRLIIHSDMEVVPWESYSFYISMLPNLEVLEIIDETKKIMPLCVFYKVLKGLAGFQTLKRINLEANIEKQVPQDTLFIVGEELYNKLELKAINDIKGRILRIISANPMLDELNIGKFEGYNIPRIFYKKLMKKESR